MRSSSNPDTLIMVKALEFVFDEMYGLFMPDHPTPCPIPHHLGAVRGVLRVPRA